MSRPGPHIVVNYCCTRVLLYAKMIKNKTETEETIVFFVTFLFLVAFQLRGLGPWLPLATPVVGADAVCNFQNDGRFAHDNVIVEILCDTSLF